MPRGPEKGHGAAGRAIDGDLLVLGADAPLAARLGARCKVLDQRITTGHRSLELGGRLDEIGHGLPPYSGLLAVARGGGASTR